MVNRRPKLELPIGDRYPVRGTLRDRRSASPSASHAEAAAIVTALERFMRDTAPRTAPRTEGMDPWLRAAMLEGISKYRDDDPDPWINT